MQNVLSFEVLTLKELGAIASDARIPRWSRLKKSELIDRLLRAGVVPPTVDELVARRLQEKEERAAEAAPLLPPEPEAPTVETPSPAPSAPTPAVVETKAETPSQPLEETPTVAPTRQDKPRSSKMLGSPTDENDRLVLSVCDPFWLRA